MTGGEIALTVSIAFLSVSAPATAAIFSRGRKPVDLNGKYVQRPEYEAYKNDTKDRLTRIEKVQDQMFDYIQSQLD